MRGTAHRFVLLTVIALLGGLFAAAPAGAAAPEKVTVDNHLYGVACGGDVDIIETGFIIFHEHTNGKILGNDTYHLDVIYTDGETEVMFMDRGRDKITFVDDRYFVINVAGRTSFLDDDGYAHIGNLSLVFDSWNDWELTIVDHGGQDVDVCGYFD